MSTTVARPTIGLGKFPEVRLDPTNHGRKPARAVAYLALVVACVAVFTGLYARAGHQTAVLALARPVPAGAAVTTQDLTIVRLSGTSGIPSVPATEISAVVGRHASEELQPGSLLEVDDLVASYSPPRGRSLVGVAVNASQLPASGVSPGETVDVVLTGTPGQQDVVSSSSNVAPTSSAGGSTDSSGAQPPSTGIVLVPDATVVAVAAGPASSSSNTTVVSLLAPLAVAPILAGASAAGQAALVVVAPGS